MDVEQAKPHTAAMSCGARLLRCVCVFVLSVAAAGCREANPSQAPIAEKTAPQSTAPYLARRHAHATQLRERGPSPASYEQADPPPGVVRVTYRSGELELAAWFAAPLGASRSHPAPGLVYFHGDFAFGPDDFEHVRPFVDAGFAVLTPMLRGENGNPGDFELLWGEIDDARAAIPTRPSCACSGPTCSGWRIGTSRTSARVIHGSCATPSNSSARRGHAASRSSA